MPSSFCKTRWQQARAIALASVTALVGLGVGLCGYSVHATDTSNSGSTASNSGPTNSVSQSTSDDVWAQIQNFHDRMDQLFAKEFGQVGSSKDHVAVAVPNMDVRDLKDHYQIVMDMPRANQNSIKVNVQGKLLSVSGQRTMSSNSERGCLVRSERSTAAWERAVTLPGPVDAAEVKSNYTNGVLTITVPKTVGSVATAPKEKRTEGVLAAAGPQLGNSSPPAQVVTPFVAANTWDQLDQFHNNMDQLFADTFGAPDLAGDVNAGAFTVPSLDITDHKDHYAVSMDMPGVDKSKIKVNVDGRQLSVSGQRLFGNDEKGGGTSIHTERGTAEFERSVTLPGPVRVNAVSAKYDNGILTIDLPKAVASASPISVTVQ